MMIKEVAVHVGECREREVYRSLAVSMDIYTIFPHVQSNGNDRRSVSHTLVTDERHSVVIDIRHTRLKETHHVGEVLEAVGCEYILVDVHYGRGIAVGQGIFTYARMGYCHNRSGEHYRLEIRCRDICNVRKGVVETEGDLTVRSDLRHYRE